MPRNPFTYGNPITAPARFIGREREVDQIYSRLLNAEFESSSVVGERRIGKTSLLNYLSHPNVIKGAAFTPGEYIFVYIDLQILNPTKTPTDFWRRVLRAIRQQVLNADLRLWIDETRGEPSIDAFILDDVFGLVDDLNLHIVLLLDEFERVTQNNAFDIDFFSGLRSIAIHHNLALITSSHRELVELTHSRAVQDSPFFNIFANINLRPFSDQESKTLIATYLAASDLEFHSRDIDHVLWIAGPHPYFLQMACSLLYDAYRDFHKEPESQARRRYLDKEFREEAAPVFSDYWHHSSNEQRTLLALLSRRHREHRESEHTLETLCGLYSGAESVLVALEKRGLVLAREAAEPSYRLLSPAFGDWIAKEIRRPPKERTAEAELLVGKPAEFARLVHLRRVLLRQFSINELRTVCFDMNIDFEALTGDNKEAQVRELLAYIERRQRVNELIKTIRELRPDVKID